MRSHARELTFSKMTTGEPVTGRCSVCKHVFIAKAHGNERHDVLVLRVREEFNAHDCNLDSSQNALRIEGEAADS
jgi:hypothetical protein